MVEVKVDGHTVTVTQDIEYGFWVALDNETDVYGKGNSPREAIEDYEKAVRYVK